MKKHIIAAAVAAAFAVPAMAQVTVSGNVEAGWASAKRDTAGKQVGGTAGYTYTGIASAVVGTPTIRFSGAEDLGGGMKATFQLDFEHNTATGAVDSYTASASNADIAGGGADLSIALVGVSGPFGSVSMGKGALSTRDAGGVYRFFGNAGRLASDSTFGTVLFNSDDEAKGLFEYVSPKIQGFSISYGFADEGRAASATSNTTSSGAGQTSQRIDGIGIRGTIGSVTVSYGQETERGANATTKEKLNTFGGNVNLGMARVGFVYAESKSTSEVTSKAIGGQVAVPMGAFTVGGSYTNYTTTTTGDPKTDIMTLNAVYALSKRTAVHTSFQSVASGTTAVGIGSSRGLGVRAISGATNTGYNLSVVHSF